MVELDPRIHAYRPDLAAESLRGQVRAAQFVTGQPAQVAWGVADLRRHPSKISGLSSQLLCGETVTLYDKIGEWAWVQNHRDHYVGYVEVAALRSRVYDTTHQVAALRTFLFPEPDLKSPPLDSLPMASTLRITGESGAYSEVAGGGWVYSRHLRPDGDWEPDYIATALAFMGVPYLWGGKNSLGLDCSGLVQVALARAGVASPRDSDLQLECIGSAVPLREGETPIRRGDLIYFPGHVAIALDERQVLHANAGAMQVAIEELAPVAAQISADNKGRGITAIRRLDDL